MQKTKISIIGIGYVGSATAYAIALKNIVDEICLIDINEDKARAEALDIGHAATIVGNTVIKQSSYKDAKNSDIVIITAGAQQKVGETRLDVIGRSIKMYKNIIPEVIKYNKDSILLVVGNPVDVLTYYAYKLSGFPKERVISSGTILDSNRLIYYISNYLKVSYSNVEGITLGEHGDSQVIIWDKVKVYGIPIEKYCEFYNIKFDKEIKEDIDKKVKKSAYEIIKGKGYTNFGIGEAVARAVSAIIKNESVMLPLGTLYNGEFNIEDVVMAAPCLVNKKGIDKIIKSDISKTDIEKLKESGQILKKMIKDVMVD